MDKKTKDLEEKKVKKSKDKAPLKKVTKIVKKVKDLKTPIKKKERKVKKEEVVEEKVLSENKVASEEIKPISKNHYLLNIIIVLVVICLLFFLIRFLFCKEEDDVLILGPYDSSVLAVAESGDVISTYSGFHNTFDSKKISKSRFDENNFVVFVADYDANRKKDIELVNYYYENGILNLFYEYNEVCSNDSDIKYSYYFVPVEKSVAEANLVVDYKKINDIKCIEY